MQNFSDPTDPAQLCVTCREEMALARRGVYYVHTYITDRDTTQQLIRDAHESEKSYKLCARCALRPVMDSDTGPVYTDDPEPETSVTPR